MKIVHLSTFGGGRGGAGGATYRLHESLSAFGLDSQIVAMKKVVDSSSVSIVDDGRCVIARSRLAPYLSVAAGRALRVRNPRAWSTGLGAFDPSADPRIKSAEIVGLYWVGAGYLSVSAIGRLLSLGKPVVWRLSDMWPFTGGCHYSGACRRYAASCGQCPEIAWPVNLDPTWAEMKWKSSAWDVSRLHLVTPSDWMRERVKQSSLFSRVPVSVIRTSVDTDNFRPLGKREARLVLGLPPRAPIVLFVGQGGHRDIRKGGDLVAMAISCARRTVPGLHLVMLGPKCGPPGLPSVTALGHVQETQRLSLIYSAADLLLAPSREDNLPNTVLESLACGTPIVAFGGRGVAETASGTKACAEVEYDPTGRSLARGLLDMLGRLEAEADEVRTVARSVALEKHGVAGMVEEYATLYRRLLKERNG